MSPSAQEEGSFTTLPTRTKRLSHPSSSVPSTPRQHAHSLPSFDSRTPSPGQMAGNHSPRSVASDSRSPLPAFRQGPAICRFMSTQTSRRRIPYTIGSDLLPDPTETPKVALEASAEQKLSGDMRELYDRLLPSTNSRSRRDRVAVKLKSILEETFPDKAIQVHMFGSSGNLLCTSKSDVDICITMKGLESTCVLADALSKRGMERVTCVHAKAVPIVKIWDPELLLACDLNVNNHVAVKNTQLIKTYTEIDERVRPLAMTIKHWAKQRILNEGVYPANIILACTDFTASGGTLSSYTWTLLIINFLQTRQPPILPVISLEDEQGLQKGDFSNDLRKLFGFGAANKETLGQLLFHFFRRYGYEIDYQTAVISVRKGKVITKQEKHWHMANNNRLCVEEPFNTDRNLANTADDTAFRGLHLELRQAFERISTSNDLASVCEKYEFPPEEPRSAIDRPHPPTRPIIPRSASQSGRGGRGRGGKQHNSFRNGQNNRRASSGAVFGANPSMLPQSPFFPAMIPGYMPHLVQPEQGLHNQLAQEFQLLQAQEIKLKAVQAIRAQAAQAQVMAQNASRGSSVSSQPRGSGDLFSPRIGSFDSPTSIGSSYQGSYPYPYEYAPVPMSQSSSQPGTDTNQSSPSLTPATLRRALQRPAMSNGSMVPSTRSHSQPARPIAAQISAPMYGRAPNGFIPTNQMQAMYFPPGYRSGYYTPAYTSYGPVPYFDPSNTAPIPREYLGYGIGESPQLLPQYIDPRFQSIPPYEELMMRTRGRSSPGVGNDLGSLGSPMQGSSQSPSPRTFTEDGTYTASPHLVPETYENDYVAPVSENGPFIVNGSHSAPIPVERGHGLDTMPQSKDVLQQTEPNQGSTMSLEGPIRVDAQPNPRSPQPPTGLGIQSATSPPYQPAVPIMAPPPRPKEPSTPPRDPVDTSEDKRPRMSPDLRQRVNRRVSSAKATNLPALDLAKSATEPSTNNDSAPKSAPLLSPVLETRTPSPTTTRKHDFKRDSGLNGAAVPTLASIVGRESANGSARSAPSSAPLQPPPLPPPAATMVAPSPWQQVGAKKAKKRGGSVNLPVGGSGSFSRGEPLPANGAERKGG